MKRIKAFFYNNQWNYIVAILVCFIIILLSLEEKTLGILITEISILIYFFVNIVVNQVKSKNLNYFQYGYILFCKKLVWINQHVKKKRDMNKCPQKEFVRDLGTMLKEIPEGTICYCCTHELIKKHILVKYPEAEITEAYKKDLKRLKRKMKNNKCKKCTVKECTLLKSDKTQFYSIRFVKKNTDHQ